MDNCVPNNLEIGERIRKIRESFNMNREKFSEMIDISDVFLGQLERGERSLSLKTLFRLVSFTGISSDFILFGDTNNNSNLEKINRILSKSSDITVNFAYELIRSSFTLLKGYKK